MKAVVVFMLAAVLSASTSAFAQGGIQDCAGDVNGDNVVDVDDLVAVILDWGCVGPDCEADVNGDEVVDVDDLVDVILDWGCMSQGTLANLSGVVTNAMTGAPIEGASVWVGPVELLTNAMGEYAGDFDPSEYQLTFNAQYFNEYVDSMILFPGLAAEMDVALDPVAAVVVELSTSSDPGPGDAVSAMADVIILDGSTIDTMLWSQIAGPTAMIADADMATATVTTAGAGDYKDHLIDNLLEPPIGPEQLPPNVPLPPEPFPGGLQDRYQIVALNPFVLEESGLLKLGFDVTTTSGTYGSEIEVHTHLPWVVNSGLRNQPIDVPLLLYGKTQGSYDWALTSVPSGSVAALTDETTQSPYFTPDVAGVYEVTVTDEATMSPVTLQIYTGNWRGVIFGQDMDGRPVADPTCVGCHQAFDVDLFTPWAQTGHAEIFTDNLNTSSYYNTGCFKCHLVGYNTEATNNGADDASDYMAFLSSGLLGSPSPDNWTTVLSDYPEFAAQANVQCENCHGPQDSTIGGTSLAHGPLNPIGEPRKDLSADVCAQCHGEPLRHARFQQWQLSAHANYAVAIDESQSGTCSRCHTANGFLEWLPVLLGDEPGDPQDPVTVTWTEDEAHPQTCVVCHDPHNIGTQSGDNNNAIIRITGDSPPLAAGFTAYGIGDGAMCITCHNSRRGLRNDDTFDQYYLTSEAARAPHGGAQGDMVMGENAYFVQTGIRGPHSLVTDACVACHMKETDPPDDLSYNAGGANHTFYASIEVCAECHGDAVDGEYIQGGVHDTLEVLQGLLEDAIYDLIAEQTGAGNIVDFNGDVQVTDAATIADLEFGEYRGRQSIIVTFTDMSVLGPYRLTDVDVIDGMDGMTILGQLYDFAPPELPKAGWNYGLVHNDGSGGVHNPVYAYWVMTEAITALEPAMAMEWPDWLPNPKTVSESTSVRR